MLASMREGRNCVGIDRSKDRLCHLQGRYNSLPLKSGGKGKTDKSNDVATPHNATPDDFTPDDLTPDDLASLGFIILKVIMKHLYKLLPCI